MALIFEDQFNEPVPTLLEDHKPDLGDGWSILFDSFTVAVVEVKPVGNTDVANVVGPNTSDSGAGRAYAIRPAPAVADVVLEVDVYESNWSRSNTYNRGLFARDTGGHTHYAVSILPNGHSQPSIRLFKTVAGSSEVIGSYDAELQNGDVIRFECYDIAKRVLLNGVEVISVADNTISGAGDAGLFWGNWNNQNGDGHPDRRGEFGSIKVEAASTEPVFVDLAAAVTASSSTVADVAPVRSLVAQADAQGSVTVALHADRSLASASASTTTVAGDVAALRSLEADAVMDVTVAAALEQKGRIDLAAHAAWEATVAGDLAVLRDVMAEIASGVAVDATLSVLRDVAAEIASGVVVDAALSVLSFVELQATAQVQMVVQAQMAAKALGAVGDVRTHLAPVTTARSTHALVTTVQTRGRLVSDVVTAVEGLA